MPELTHNFKAALVHFRLEQLHLLSEVGRIDSLQARPFAPATNDWLVKLDEAAPGTRFIAANSLQQTERIGSAGWPGLVQQFERILFEG